MRNSITFRKLIILFSGVIIPFFLLSLFLLQQNNIVIEQRIFSSIQYKTDLTAQTLTDVITQIYDTSTGMAEQSILRRLASPGYPSSAYETAKDILQLKEQQTSIKNANKYIENFVIYYQERGQAYNSSGNGRPSFFEFTSEEYQDLVTTRKYTGFLVFYDQKLTELIQSSTNSNFLIRVNLSSEAITDLLCDTFTEYEYYYLLDMFDSDYQLTNLSDEQLTQLSNNTKNYIQLNNEQYHCFSSSLPFENAKLHFFFSDKQLFAPTQNYQYLAILVFLLALVTCCIFLGGSYKIVHKPINTLIGAFQDINNQNYNVRIFTKNNSDFSFLYQEFDQMAKHLGILIEKNYQQQLLLNKAELKQLQAQINPHFLYNSLFLLRRMIQDELYEEAYHMSDTLGLYFQYITRNSQEYPLLSQEYRHAVLYCEIQKLRFAGRICVETEELPSEFSNLLVPKLIIQPILENAFNYGLRNKEKNGLLKVTFSSNSSELIISIEDNGDDLSDVQLEKIQTDLIAATTSNPLQEMTGILNIQRRLHIYFDGSGHLVANRSPLGGLQIHLVLPIQLLSKKDVHTND